MSGLVLLSSIAVAPNRQRREFTPTELNELADSIEANGLLHPPVIRFADGQPILVAGERRLRAITDMYALARVFRFDGQLVPLGYVPAQRWASSTPCRRGRPSSKRTSVGWTSPGRNKRRQPPP